MLCRIAPVQDSHTICMSIPSSASEAVPCPVCACWKIAAEVNAAALEALQEKLYEYRAGEVRYKEDIADLKKEI